LRRDRSRQSRPEAARGQKPVAKYAKEKQKGREEKPSDAEDVLTKLDVMVQAIASLAWPEVRTARCGQ
jgi:hypothetical protein